MKLNRRSFIVASAATVIALTREHRVRFMSFARLELSSDPAPRVRGNF
jgi:hypothetical protein